MNKLQSALELRRALQMFLSTLDVETESEKILSVPSVFPKYEIGKNYKTKDVFGYGENAVGDTQLYQVLQDHTSSKEHTPDTATSLYKKIGVTDEGIPEWVQPLGATDSYMTGDNASHNGEIWTSTLDYNTYEPGVYGWVKKA